MTEMFDIAATSRGTNLMMVAISVVAAFLTVGILGYITMTMNHMYIEAGPDSIKVRIPMYTKTIRRADLVVDEILVIDMTDPESPKLAGKSNGINLPGMWGGWFRKKGGGKVLAAITDKRKVIVIPTTLGYEIMASVNNPEALIATLKMKTR